MALVEKAVPSRWRGSKDELVLDWSALEPGDRVAFLADTRSYYGSRAVLHTVERLTGTQIIMEDGSRWYRKNGRMVAARDWEALRHPQDDAVIDSLLASEDRLFKRALEDLAKRRTTTQEQRLRDKQDAEKIAAEYGVRLLALEVTRALVLTPEERSQMLSEVPEILARHNVTGEAFQGLTDDLTAWLEACIVATGMFEYGRGQRSVLSPRT